jgi:hypothetical protein
VRDIAARSHHPARPRLTATAFAFTLGRSITLRIPTRAGLQPANREDDCQDAVILRHRSATPVQLRACSQDARGSARSAASAQPRRSGDPQTPGVTIRASFASWVHVGRYDHRRGPSLGIAWLGATVRVVGRLLESGVARAADLGPRRSWQTTKKSWIY